MVPKSLEAQLRQPSEPFDCTDKVDHVKTAAVLNPIFSDQGQAAVKWHDGLTTPTPRRTW